MPCERSLLSLSLRMLVGGDSGESAISLKRDLPSKRSRITNSVHLSPNMSRLHAIGQGERRSERVLLLFLLIAISMAEIVLAFYK